MTTYRLLLMIVGFALGFVYNANAQDTPNYSIKGQVGDPLEKLKLKQAVVLLVQAKDSILVDFTRTDKDGRFSLTKLKPNAYLVILTHPDYAEFSKIIEVKDKNEDLGEISLMLKSKLIEEVVISGVRPITIKGDTTEFDPRAFQVDANAKVEDLIKKFPGIQVDANGKITAFGEKVEKVLIDGEEFFGNDPVLVTRNIRADMVSKVQMYDKKSEESELTGVDDGTRSKTLNFVLKDDKKKGYFGKASAGVTQNELYQLQGMANRFKDKLRLSIYATQSTTNLSGLDSDDSFKLFGMDGMDMFEMDDGTIAMMYPGGGSRSSAGIPKVFNGGLYLNNKTKNDQLSYTIDYKGNRTQNEGFSRSLIQDFLPGGTQFSDQNQNTFSLNMGHNLGTKFQWKLDSMTNLNVNINAGWKDSEQSSNNQDFTLSELQDTLNRSNRFSDNYSESRDLNARFIFNKRMQKKGRSFSTVLGQSYTENDGDGSLLSNSKFYAPNGELLVDQAINQRKTQDSKNLNLNGRINWREPIAKNLIWTLSANSAITKLENDNRSWNRTAGSNIEELDSVYTNDLLTTTLKYGVGNSLTYSTKSFYFNIGGNLNQDDHNRKDRFLGNDFDRSFLNSDYSGNIMFTLLNKGRLNISGSGRSSAPSLEQLQPLRQNTNPLYLQVGNLDLAPSYGHNFSLSYNKYSILTSRFIYVSGGVNFTNRPIVQNSSTDEVGRTVYFFENLSGKQPITYRFYASYDQPVKFMKADMSLGVNYNAGENYSMINGQINGMDNKNLGFEMNLRKDFKVVQYSFGFTPTYLIQKSSLQPETNNDGWNMSSRAKLDFKFPAKIKLETEGNYTYQPATAAFSEDFQRVLVHLRLEKKFMKDESLAIQLSVNDLLNEGTGLTRSVNQNRIVQMEQTYLGRYFLLGLKWDFNLMGK